MHNLFHSLSLGSEHVTFCLSHSPWETVSLNIFGNMVTKKRIEAACTWISEVQNGITIQQRVSADKIY